MRTALYKSEVKFRTMAEAIAAAIFIYQDTQLLYVNSAFCTITGYSQAELLEMNAWDFVHPDHQALTSNFRFWILDFGLKEFLGSCPASCGRNQSKILKPYPLVGRLNPKSAIQNPKSVDARIERRTARGRTSEEPLRSENSNKNW